MTRVWARPPRRWSADESSRSVPCDISLIHLWIRLVPAGAMASRVALSVLSLLPVVCGARRAARRGQVKQAACAVEEPAHGWLAARAPLCSGVALLALHFLYRMCPHDVLSEVLAVYSLVLGTVAFLYSIRPTALAMLPEGFPNTWYQVTLNQGLGTARREIWSMRFDRRDLLSLAASLSVGLCYFVTKHWAAGDVLTVSLALRGVELLPLCSIPAACLLFACLCLHDITWCQELSGLEGNIPIALVFPKALFGDGVDVSPFVVVPLDTVVIPALRGIVAFTSTRDSHHMLRDSVSQRCWNSMLCQCFLIWLQSTLGCHCWWPRTGRSSRKCSGEAASALHSVSLCECHAYTGCFKTILTLLRICNNTTINVPQDSIETTWRRFQASVDNDGEQVETLTFGNC
ncbi:signal peptide peptidase-like isoform X5 [Lampetra fluviatilis]